MLTICLEEGEFYDEAIEEFVIRYACTFNVEHSLISISKWETLHKKPFFSTVEKTDEETISYIKCMTINKNVPDFTYETLPRHVKQQLAEYIQDPATATTFAEGNQLQSARRNREVVTSELIYYWMVVSGIPIECQTWHINRLLALIRIFSIKNSKQKKRPLREIMAENRALNEARKAEFGSRG